MKWIFCGMIGLSVLFGALNGRIEAVSNAAIQSCGTAVQLVITLTGAMCLWSGIMRVADKAGITSGLARLFSPVLGILFCGLSPQSPARKSICMNVTANLLGLGNAATPFGIQAMKELQAENNGSQTASRHMITFVVLNTASVQLIPTTIAALRLQHGSSTPLDVLPAILITSLTSLMGALLAVKLCQRLLDSPKKGGASCSR